MNNIISNNQNDVTMLKFMYKQWRRIMVAREGHGTSKNLEFFY